MDLFSQIGEYYKFRGDKLSQICEKNPREIRNNYSYENLSPGKLISLRYTSVM